MQKAEGLRCRLINEDPISLPLFVWNERLWFEWQEKTTADHKHVIELWKRFPSFCSATKTNNSVIPFFCLFVQTIFARYFTCISIVRDLGHHDSSLWNLLQEILFCQMKTFANVQNALDYHWEWKRRGVDGVGGFRYKGRPIYKFTIMQQEMSIL